MKRIAVFIDGNNFYYGLRKLYGRNKSLKNFNFKYFSDYLANKNKVVDIFYYNAELDIGNNPEKYNSQKEFFEVLKKIPNFHLTLCKLLKRNITGTDKFYYIIKEDDINMAVDMVEGACGDNFDIAIVVSGDGDFVPAVKAVQRKNKIVENVYFKNSSSRNLKNHCDKSLELKKEILDKLFNKKFKIIDCPGCGECITDENPFITDKKDNVTYCKETGTIIEGKIEEIKKSDSEFIILKVILNKSLKKEK